MTKIETEENPDPKPISGRQKRRNRQKQLIAEKTALQIPVVPPLKINGRPRSLDPDQATMDKSLQVIIGCATINCTDAETAATLGVHEDTLAQFFERYPEARARYEDARQLGVASVRRNQFNLSAKSPQMAIYLGEQVAGQRDPYKMADIERREREFAEHIRLEEEKLALRERDVRAKERLLEMRAPTDLGSGLPIDIKSLSLPQLMQLAERIRSALTAGNALTIDHVAAKVPEKTE